MFFLKRELESKMKTSIRCDKKIVNFELLVKDGNMSKKLSSFQSDKIA